MLQSEMNKIDKMNNKKLFNSFSESKKRIQALEKDLSKEREILNYLIEKIQHALSLDIESESKNILKQEKKSKKKNVYTLDDAPSIKAIRSIPISQEEKEKLRQEVYKEAYGLNENV